MLDKTHIKTYNIGYKNYKVVYITYKREIMLEDLFGSKNRERVLRIYLQTNKGMLER